MQNVPGTWYGLFHDRLFFLFLSWRFCSGQVPYRSARGLGLGFGVWVSCSGVLSESLSHDALHMRMYRICLFTWPA